MNWRMEDRGFSLVEVLVVMVVMGLVTVAVYSTFLSSQRHAYTQDEVVEVQQNLRAALDYMAKDIRMAAFMAPSDEDALASAPTQMLIDGNGDGDYDDPDDGDGDPSNDDDRPILSLVSATSMHGYARVVASAVISTNLELKLSPNTVHQFNNKDRVRVFRPNDLNSDTDIYEITVSASDNKVVLVGAGSEAGDVDVGDLLVQMPPGAGNGDFPLQINYRLADDGDSSDANMNLLQRRVRQRDGTEDGGDITGQGWELIASKISSIALTYLDDDGNTTTDLDEVVAIQITMTAQTDATKTGKSNFSGVKTRTLSTTVKIHNGVTL